MQGVRSRRYLIRNLRNGCWIQFTMDTIKNDFLRSLWYLDLSTFIYYNDDIFAFKTSQKEVIGNRTMCELHLDFPAKMQSDMRNMNQIPEDLSTEKCEGWIVETILQSRDKLQTLKRFLGPIKRMGLYKDDYRFYVCLVPVLIEECRDSNLAIEFTKICSRQFTEWLITFGTPSQLEYFLHHAQRMKHNLWGIKCAFLSPNYHPINITLLAGRTENIYHLLQYGLTLVFTDDLLAIIQTAVNGYFLEDTEKDIDLGCIPKRRALLVFLVMAIYFCSRDREMLFRISETGEVLCIDSDKALRYLWRSLPDAFLCKHEIFAMFQHAGAKKECLTKICEYYKNEICEDSFSEHYNPRTLSHYSRCKIRAILGEKNELPYGINRLNLPYGLISYLQMFY